MSDPSFDDFEPIARCGQMSILVKTDDHTVSLANEFMASHGKDVRLYAVAWITSDAGEQFPCGFASRERLLEYAEEIAAEHVGRHLDPNEPLKPDVVRLIAAELEMIFVHPMMADEVLADAGDDGVAGALAALAAVESRRRDRGGRVGLLLTLAVGILMVVELVLVLR